MKSQEAYQTTVYDGHRTGNVPQRLAHLLPLLVENHPVRYQSPVRTESTLFRRSRCNGGEQLTLEPTAVLVRAFETYVRSRDTVPSLVQHRPRRPAVEPDIHRVRALPPDRIHCDPRFSQCRRDKFLNGALPPILDPFLVEDSENVF